MESSSVTAGAIPVEIQSYGFGRAAGSFLGHLAHFPACKEHITWPVHLRHGVLFVKWLWVIYYSWACISWPFRQKMSAWGFWLFVPRKKICVLKFEPLLFSLRFPRIGNESREVATSNWSAHMVRVLGLLWIQRKFYYQSHKFCLLFTYKVKGKRFTRSEEKPE